MSNRKFKHEDRHINKEFESVYNSIAVVNENSNKQKSIVGVKEIPSESSMEDRKLYAADDGTLKIKIKGVVKTVTLT